MNTSKDNLEVGVKNNKPTLSHERENVGIFTAELAQIKKTNQ